MEVVFFSLSLVLSLSRFHESPLCSLLRHISFFSFPRASLWLAHGGVAVFFLLHRASFRPPFFHFTVTGGGGWERSEDLAEGHLPQEAFLRIQGDLRQQHQFLSGTKTVVQKDGQGPARMTFKMVYD